jgi:hypothetical protein
LNLRGKGCPSRERKTASDYGRGVKDSKFWGGHVKGPRATAAVAGFAPDDLSQDFPRIPPFSDDMTMITVRAENIILSRQSFADGNASSLLYDVNVEVATDEPLVIFVETDDVFLGTPDHEHLAQNAKLLFA